MPASSEYTTYLNRLSTEGSRTMRGCLDTLAKLITLTPDATGANIPWHTFTPAQASELRHQLTTQAWSPATLNKHLSAFRGVIKEAWRQGKIDADTRDRLTDLRNAPGTREKAGRAVHHDDLDRLLDVCRNDPTPAGTRDAAVIAVLYTTGIRRDEAVHLDVGHWDSHERTITVIAKGDKQLTKPVSLVAVPWLEKWLALRTYTPGPLFPPILKNGKIIHRRLRAQAMRDVLRKRSLQAGVQPVNPHDLRRTMIGDLLDEQVDLPTVQAIAGHVSPVTTSMYDRRGARTRLDAVDRLTLTQPS